MVSLLPGFFYPCQYKIGVINFIRFLFLLPRLPRTGALGYHWG
jgi:hypothetical protein